MSVSLNGIAHILVRYKLIDREYVAEHTTGFAELEEFLEAYQFPHYTFDFLL